MKMWLVAILIVLILVAIDITVRIGWDRFASGIGSLVDDYWPAEQAKPNIPQQPLVGAQRPSEWYNIAGDYLGRRVCELLDGAPADHIEIFRKPGLDAIKMTDVVEKGIVVQTTMTITDKMTGSTVQATYYRGKERCAMALARYQAETEQERRKLDRYR
jgi:hypothetical protein